MLWLRGLKLPFATRIPNKWWFESQLLSIFLNYYYSCYMVLFIYFKVRVIERDGGWERQCAGEPGAGETGMDGSGGREREYEQQES